MKQPSEGLGSAPSDEPEGFTVPTPRSYEEITGELAHCYHMLSLWNLSFMERIAELDEREIYESDGLSSTAEWLCKFLGIGYRHACKLVEVAVAIPKLPRLAQAYREGRLTFDHLRALVRVADEENEEELLTEVEGMSVADTFKLVRLRLQVTAEDSQLARSERWLEMRRDAETRNLFLFGQFPEELGTRVERAIDAMATRMPEDPSFEFGPTPMGTKRADALCALADSYLSQNPSVPQLIVHVEAASVPTGEGVGDIEDGPTVLIETVRQLMCDGSLKLVLEGEDGTLLGMDVLRRAPSKALRRELKRRDKRCRFPGCRRRKGLHAHHIELWPKGKTEPSNLVLLCETHHWLVHPGGWTVRGSPPKVWFEKPELPPIKIGPPKIDPETLAAFDLDFATAMAGAARGP